LKHYRERRGKRRSAYASGKGTDDGWEKLIRTRPGRSVQFTRIRRGGGTTKEKPLREK